MIKKSAITLIDIYQIFISTVLKSILGTNRFCRFDETCSQYTKRAIIENGILKGVGLGLARISKCQPFYNPNKINGNI
ncbi:MAG: membrane protein insertion efficiency factor YidD [Candidatus Levybacteria bacterium]|nr:membrane protein insertion efficiency factor YidD [Candidatus Levybacteria bacterium]